MMTGGQDPGDPFESPAGSWTFQDHDPKPRWKYPTKTEEEHYALQFVMTWAEAVLRQAERLEAAQERFRIECEDDDLIRSKFDDEFSFRELWAEQHSLVWAAHQMEQWNKRLAASRRKLRPAHDEILARLRNILEHLDEAGFKDGHAVPGPKSRSLKELPGQKFPIELDHERLFGLVSVDALVRRANELDRDEEEDSMIEALLESLLEDVIRPEPS